MIFVLVADGIARLAILIAKEAESMRNRVLYRKSRSNICGTNAMKWLFATAGTIGTAADMTVKYCLLN